MFTLIQMPVLALILGWALWTLFGRVAPMAQARVQNALATALMSPQVPRLLNRLGLWMLPRVATHCGSGCSRCGACR